MKVFKLFSVLYKIRLLSPLALFFLLKAFLKNGINLMTLLHFAGMKHAQQIAIVDDDETLTYKQLSAQSMKLAVGVKRKFNIQVGQKVGFICKNHASLVKSIFAVSRLGADIYLLNAEMSKKQFNELETRHHFDILIYDEELSALIEDFKREKIPTYHNRLPAINNALLTNDDLLHLPRTTSSKLILQTSGTTGISKDAAHKPSLFNYLNPFLAFIDRLKILKYQTSYIATPIYHGYGIAVLLLFIPLGKKAVISKSFNAEKACRLICEHQVEVVTVVPLMLQRMLQISPENLSSIACIASGGAKLSTKLIKETSHTLGSVLYNLYGTSEAGLNFIAKPQDLKYDPNTIGKQIDGIEIQVRHHNQIDTGYGVIGQIYIKNDWSIRNTWIKTGDLGYRDEHGYYYLCGRTDDMIISGGENVYPIEVEQVLVEHPMIEDVAVIGIKDEQFGQRLKAFVLLVQNVELSNEELCDWLRPRLARYQMPKEIIFVEEMPYTSIGKLDKKQLSK